MTFRFIHTADWQIGKSFGAFDGETAVLLRKERVSAIDRIAGLARDRGIEHVLVAGDVFDTESGKTALYHQPIAKLKAHRHVTWHLLPGNHDPARREGGIWPLILSAGLPENVKVYMEPGSHGIAPGVELLAAPVTSKSMGDDPTRWMAGDTGRQGDIRIGLAHGSVEDFGEDGGGTIIAPDRAQTAGLCYLALGDWHGLKKINERCWYSGTPEPDGWRRNDPGHVLAVEVEEGNGAPRVEAVKTAHYVWHEQSIDVSHDAEINRAFEEIEGLDAQPDRLLLKLRLKGVISPKRYAGLEERIAVLDDRCRAVLRRESGLEKRVIESDIQSLSHDGTLHLAAQSLLEDAEGADDAARATSVAALQRLFLYAARLDREAER